jgi:hypothetical protein
VQERLPGAIAQALELQHPAVVVRARLEAAPAGFDPVAFSGRTYPGAVIVATRRLVPFLPSIIQLLQR